ncbi:hypothetical protein KsCSTR_04330 [Candidatus Kuenenia stuttgartiensis]|uniref:Uncharacterized protein n=1 Tax=Kuenenia stuttgartiensis TaxID=174633 RepID=A0A6G7GKC9_KUEST|nr:hypothetical protein KsCSTR_04330 [Candidatus Kuenenia stuttgartiensis]
MIFVSRTRNKSNHSVKRNFVTEDLTDTDRETLKNNCILLKKNIGY